MENASKALLIAGGVLIALLTLSLFFLMRSNVETYYNEQDKIDTVEKITAFNLEYTNYNRNNVRGNELLSLINKVIDYNDRKSDKAINNSQAPSINLTIDFDGKVKKLSFDENLADNKRLFGKNVYNEEYKSDLSSHYSKDLDDIISYIRGIENDYTAETLKQLISKISILYSDVEGNTEKENNAIIAFNDIVGTQKVGANLLKTNQYSSIKNLKEPIYKYYEFSQFKKAVFKCYDVTYNSNGKIESMAFKFTGSFK